MLSIKGNPAREKLASGGCPLGVLVSYIRTPTVMEIIGSAGYDFVAIDMRHSVFSIETVSDMCRVAKGVGLVPIVRPLSHTAADIQRILEQGAMGLMYSVASRSDVDEIRKVLRKDDLLVVQLESGAAVESVEAIVDGGGIDVVGVGRHDLANSYGVPGEIRHPRVLQAVDAVVKACRKEKVSVGGYGRTREDAEDLIRRGVRWLICESDLSLLTSGLKRSINDAREVVNELVVV